MWDIVLVSNMLGLVDKEKLTLLRRSLDLLPHGRMDDDEDQDFGYRFLVDNGVDHSVRLTLWRVTPDRWRATLLATPADVPSRDELTQLLAEIRAAAQSVGLTIERETIWPG